MATRMCGLLLVVLATSALEPPRKEPPAHLLARYTMDGLVPLDRFYVDDTDEGAPTHYAFAKEDMDGFVQWAQLILDGNRGTARGGRPPRLRPVQKHLVMALQKLRPHLADASALVFGTMEPWVEVLLLTAGCKSVTTVEYNALTFEHDRLHTVLLDDFVPDATYDVAVAVSSFDHDGLGRYGDRLHPDGDLLAMRTAWASLKPLSGRLLLGLPVGADLVVWNLHRRYGPHRLPRMLQGWQEEDRFGWDDERGAAASDHRIRHEPVFALRKNSSSVALPVEEPPPLPDEPSKDEL